MTRISPTVSSFLALAALAVPLSAQQDMGEDTVTDPDILVTADAIPPTDLKGLPAGPELEGFISARKDNQLQVTTTDGSKTVVVLSEGTQIKSKGGFLGLNTNTLAANQLANGLPVTVETAQWNNALVARQVDLKSKDLRTAAMIRNGTEQGFAEQTAATEALRGRVADIDQYNVKGVTNVFFDTGEYNLTDSARTDLCSAASQAGSTENALLLVVGYTDDVGDYDFNQELSEKRATRVVNYLQQQCGWKPYRMLTPTGMAEADPAADNTTEEGKAQNRRVAVNILVSKSVDGI